MAQQEETAPPVSAAGYWAPGSQAGEARSTEPDNSSANPHQTLPSFKDFHRLPLFDVGQQASFAAWQARLAETWQEFGWQVVEIRDDESAIKISLDLEALISRRQEPGLRAMEILDHAIEIPDDAGAIKISMELAEDYRQELAP